MSECEKTDCAFHSLLRGSNEPQADYYARMRRVFQRAVQRPRITPSRQPIDRTPLLALLSADRWMTSGEIARAARMGRSTARTALTRAIARGAAVESHPKRGYRLKGDTTGEEAQG